MKCNLFQPGLIIYSKWAANLSMLAFHIQISLRVCARVRACKREKDTWITLFSHGYSADSGKKTD